MAVDEPERNPATPDTADEHGEDPETFLPANPPTISTEPVAPTVEPRPYLELRPTESPADLPSFIRAMDALNDRLRRSTKSGLLHRLRASASNPTVEFLLVSDGQPDPSLRALIGASEAAIVESLRGTLRTAYPDSYECRLVDWHPSYLAPDRSANHPGDHSTDPQNQSNPPASPYVAAVEFAGHTERKPDWQTSLTSFDLDSTTPSHHNALDAHRGPLSSLIEAMLAAANPVIYQVLLQPTPDWTQQAGRYLDELESGNYLPETIVDQLVFPDDDFDREPPPADRHRIDAIADRDPRRCFTVTARAAVLTTTDPRDADHTADRLANALSELSGRFHTIRGHVSTDDDRHWGRGDPPGSRIYQAILDRTPEDHRYRASKSRLLAKHWHSNGIIATADELPGFLALDGAGLTPSGRRALAARPTERTGLPLPPAEQLAYYHGDGMALGRPLTHDREPASHPLILPPQDQDRHILVIGPTGAGKSILTETAMLTNSQTAAGPSILIDLKGGTAREYLQAHYRAFGSLENITYFDCTHTLPALSVLNIEPLLEAGIPHEEARSRITGHYEELLYTAMGYDRYFQAVESPKAITNHLRALFDPVNGDTAVSHHDLFQALLATLADGAPPTVSDPRLEGYFTSLLDRDRDVFNRVMGGALNRVETIATDGRLAPVFDHVPSSTDPHFDFSEILHQNQTVIFDFGGMETRAKRVLTLALLSTLWRALEARARTTPVVNLYLEEAGVLSGSTLLDTLLSQGRSFGLSLFLGIQFLGQLDSPRSTDRTRAEAVNETATLIAGQVAVEDDLVDALSADELTPAQLNRRLSRMPRGEWLVRPASAFGAESNRPFLMQSMNAPAGHPASDDPLSKAERARFEMAFERVSKRTNETHGLEHGHIRYAEPATETSEPDAEASHPAGPIDHCYAHTKRLTWTVAYEPTSHAITCLQCGNRYDPDINGLIRAIGCHNDLDDVDRDDIPIGDLNLKLSPTERGASGLTDAQLRLLQAVYSAMQGRFHPLEYDLTRDSMLRLEEYVGIDSEAVTDLIERGLLRKDTDHPFRLYSVTPDGRKIIGEAYREGLDYGHGEGDLEESTQHVLGVILAERFLEAEYRDDPESPVTAVQTYHDLGGNQRLDAAGLDEAGNVVIAVEVERVNNDLRRAAPADFDKMAACAPTEAIWVVMSHPEGHDVLAALREPLDGEPRTSKEYVRSTPVQQFVLDEPGLTMMITVDQLRTRLGIE